METLPKAKIPKGNKTEQKKKNRKKITWQSFRSVIFPLIFIWTFVSLLISLTGGRLRESSNVLYDILHFPTTFLSFILFLILFYTPFLLSLLPILLPIFILLFLCIRLLNRKRKAPGKKWRRNPRIDNSLGGHAGFRGKVRCSDFYFYQRNGCSHPFVDVEISSGLIPHQKLQSFDFLSLVLGNLRSSHGDKRAIG